MLSHCLESLRSCGLQSHLLAHAFGAAETFILRCVGPKPLMDDSELTASRRGEALAPPSANLMVMNKITRHKAGLKPCSYDPACPQFRSCRPLGLPTVANRHCRTIQSMTIRLASARFVSLSGGVRRGVARLPSGCPSFQARYGRAAARCSTCLPATARLIIQAPCP